MDLSIKSLRNMKIRANLSTVIDSGISTAVLLQFATNN